MNQRIITPGENYKGLDDWVRETGCKKILMVCDGSIWYQKAFNAHLEEYDKLGVEMIGFGTLANMVLIGYTIDLCRWIWRNIGFNTMLAEGPFALRVAVFVLSLLCFSVVAAIYINAKMGVAPYDAVSNILSKAIPVVPFFLLRIFYDLTAVMIGFFAGKMNPDGIQGSIIGSIIMSFLIGPVITLVAKPLNKIL